MLTKTTDIYDFLCRNLQELQSFIPSPSTDDCSAYIELLASITELKPYIVTQSEVKDLIPLDPEKIQYAKDLYAYLKKDRTLQNLTAPGINETFATYVEKLHLIPGIEKYGQLDELVPVSLYRKTRKPWKNKGPGLKALSEKLQTGNVLLIQDREGRIHESCLQMELKGTPLDIYRKSHDYSLALVLGGIIDQAIKEELPEQSLRKQIIDIINENLPFLHSDVAMFYEGMMVSFSNSTELQSFQVPLERIARSIADNFFKEGMTQIAKQDKKLFERWHPNQNSTPEGVELKAAMGLISDKGVLITTSNGGGCHKTIANNVANSLNHQGINVAIINESILTQIDPLQQILGLPHTDIYPVVVQQCAYKEYRDYFRKIDEHLNMNFIPPYEFAQLRNAMQFCDDKISIGTVFSTQHYSDDLRIVPLGANMIFQVCDYGHCGKLDELAKASAKLFEKKQMNYGVQFLVPSKTCIEDILKDVDKSVDYSELFVESLASTRILSEEESKQFFETLVSKEGLFPTSETNILRCAVVMGGQGCGDLIEEYINQLVINLRSETPSEKFELIVVCGNNESLVTHLNTKYKDLLTKLPPNIKIKFCGFVNNAELIAYNKNAVLITKPGGGTIAESIENRIETLIHFDPGFPWESGNALEIPIKELGIILAGKRGDDIIEVKDLNLVNEIRDATIRRNKRYQTQVDLQKSFKDEIDALNVTLRTFRKEKKDTLKEMGEMQRLFEGEESLEMAKHLKRTIKILDALKDKFPKHATALKEIDALQHMEKTFIMTHNKQKINSHLKELDNFLDTYAKVSPEVFVGKARNK